jgi:hypothetical protein
MRQGAKAMTDDNLAASTPDGPHGLLDTAGIADTGGAAHTGDARVDDAVARLDELADAPLDEHPVILGQIHDRLREVLGELGSSTPAQETPAPPGSPAAPYGPGSPGAP